MRDEFFSALRFQEETVAEQVQTLLAEYTQLWWSRERSMPFFNRIYETAEQAENEKAFDGLVNGLIHELKRPPLPPAEREAWQERMRASAMDFAKKALNLEQRHLDFIEASGMLEASQAFAKMARQYDPNISGEAIYQASRNVMTMNFIQLLLGFPVEVTPAVFAYSMLYPYTDNYLDDPAISRTTKLAFNHRFQSRLMGEKVRPANRHEETISEMVEMIEKQFQRGHYPQVYESLLAIHKAQANSMKLVAPGASPYELDVLGVSFEKGGTSVLADGYLVAGALTPEQARLMFGYGAFTQLMDDLEDVQQDLSEGGMTVFSQTANHWPLDGVTNRLFHFGRAIFSDLSAFETPAVTPLKDLMDRSLDPILMDTIGRAGQYYSRPYLREIESHMPFRFASTRRQREKIKRHRITIGRLVEAFFLDK
jgi:hypothetical protein